MKEEMNNCQNSNYNRLLKSLCNILYERSNKESSYATFLQTEPTTVNLNEFFPFNTTEIENNDIVLLNPTTIEVKKSGVYHIIYKIPVKIEDKKDPVEQSIGLYLNGILQKNVQRTFGVIDVKDKNSMTIIADIILYIPNNSIIHLKNNSFSTSSKSIFACNKEGSVALFNMVKIG